MPGLAAARLVALIEYADANLISSVWSCLAAHAECIREAGVDFVAAHDLVGPTQESPGRHRVP